MGNMSGMFSFAFWVIRALKCEMDNFIKFQLAGIPVRPFKYLDTPILIIACAPCSCVHDRIPSTTPGAEPPRGAKDSGSARSHSTHLETSSQKRP